jgi:DNA adenine methylase
VKIPIPGKLKPQEPASVGDFFGLPFLKWPGGKRWAAERIAALVSSHLTGRYYEPFLGGGAVFFRLRPRIATLGDVNSDLIAAYKAVRSNHKEIVKRLQGLPVAKSVYDEVRTWKPRGPLERAVRFLYLNRTAFGGIYRLNRAGNFNVPYGGGQRTPAILWESALIEDAAAALANVTLRACDFALVMRHATEGDVVYCDPTYTVAHENNGFLRYNERNFSWTDQMRLAVAARAARARGAVIIISNAHHASVRALYSGETRRTLERMSCVSTEPEHRRQVKETLVILEPR